MPRFILTGAPGTGKTAILRQLECDGLPVVEEAATDVIALWQARGCGEPWLAAGFTDAIVMLQRQREQLAGPAGSGEAVFFDRSPVCTLALSRYLGYPASPLLAAAVDRVVAERVYHEAAFLVRSQGFITPTAARRISLAEAMAFEEIHVQTYAELGFRLIEVPAGPLADRAELVRRAAAAAVSAPGRV